MSLELKMKTIEETYIGINKVLKVWKEECKKLLINSFQEDGTINDNNYKKYLNFVMDTKFEMDMLLEQMAMLQDLHTEYYLQLPVK